MWKGAVKPLVIQTSWTEPAAVQIVAIKSQRNLSVFLMFYINLASANRSAKVHVAFKYKILLNSIKKKKKSHYNHSCSPRFQFSLMPDVHGLPRADTHALPAPVCMFITTNLPNICAVYSCLILGSTIYSPDPVSLQNLCFPKDCNLSADSRVPPPSDNLTYYQACDQ